MPSSPDSTSTRIWDYKPWWCQPWSILLTGIGLISGSWFVFKSIWITAVVAVPVLVWMGFFLLIYPSLMRKALATGQMSIQPNPEGDFPPPQL